MKKKSLIVLCMLILVGSQVFATTTVDGITSTTGVNPIQRIMILCTGIVPGVIISCKFILDIVSAAIHKEQDPTKLQKAIINLVITVGVIVLYTVLVTYIFGSSSSGSGTGDYGGASTFIQGLTGSLVAGDALAAAGYAVMTVAPLLVL